MDTNDLHMVQAMEANSCQPPGPSWIHAPVSAKLTLRGLYIQQHTGTECCSVSRNPQGDIKSLRDNWAEVQILRT